MGQEQYSCMRNYLWHLRNRCRNFAWKFRLNCIYFGLWTFKLMNTGTTPHTLRNAYMQGQRNMYSRWRETYHKAQGFFLAYARICNILHCIICILKTITSLEKTRFTTHREKSHHIWYKENWGRVRPSIYHPLYHPLYLVIANYNAHVLNLHLLSFPRTFRLFCTLCLNTNTG